MMETIGISGVQGFSMTGVSRILTPKYVEQVLQDTWFFMTNDGIIIIFRYDTYHNLQKEKTSLINDQYLSIIRHASCILVMFSAQALLLEKKNRRDFLILGWIVMRKRR